MGAPGVSGHSWYVHSCKNCHSGSQTNGHGFSSLPRGNKFSPYLTHASFRSCLTQWACYKYIAWCSEQAREFYDLSTDPYEIKNR